MKLEQTMGERQLAMFVGQTRQAVAVRDMVQKLAKMNCTALIFGESGTGKEIVARAIHQNSPRKAQRFVALNCGAVPKNLMESELFGHERGAFTGAERSRVGRFELAEGGSLFLDEVSTMSSALQVKLLRVLQEREFERVGDTHVIKVDVRVIAATNIDLMSLVIDGKFREDLFYRLNVVPMKLPSLRERRDDIPLLVSHFLGKFSHERVDSPPMTVSSMAMEELMGLNWPGNVRQLENTIRGSSLFAAMDGSDTINLGHLKPYVMQAVGPPGVGGNGDGKMPTAEENQRLYYETLIHRYPNLTDAAKVAGIPRTTLINRLERFGLYDKYKKRGTS